MELDRALDELNAGRVPLLTDQEIRALTRLAIDVRDVRRELSPERRAAIRRRVLRSLDRSFAISLRERLAAIRAAVLRPMPLLSRAATIAIVLVGLVAGASAASADSLPDEPLYGLKLHSEQVRLSLATTAADRAAVELGIAETRLREVSALAAQDRDAEADAAASSYGEYVANAVASLEESAAGAPDLVEQLRARIVQQSDQLRAGADEGNPSALSVLASVTQEIASSEDPDGTSIADAAARAAEQAATMATTRADEVAAAPQTRVATQPTTRASARTTSRTLSPEQRAKVLAAAKSARDAAERARAAAERAKKAAAEKAKRHARSAGNERGESR